VAAGPREGTINLVTATLVASSRVHGVLALLACGATGHAVHSVSGTGGRGSTFASFRSIVSIDWLRRRGAEAAAYVEVRSGGRDVARNEKWRVYEARCEDAARCARVDLATARETVRAQPCVVMTYGKPGAGKSTCADRLATLLGGEVIRRDKKSDAVVKDDIRRIVGEGRVAIVDSTHSSAQRRRPIYYEAQAQRVPIFVFEVDAPVDMCTSRVEARREALRQEMVEGDGHSKDCIYGTDAAKAVRDHERLIASQPLGLDVELMEAFAGHDAVFVVDGTASMEVVERRCREVAGEIRNYLADAAAAAQEALAVGVSRDVFDALRLPRAADVESDGATHLERVVAAAAGQFADEALPGVFGVDPGLFANRSVGGDDGLRRRMADALGVDADDLPRPVEAGELRAIVGWAVSTLSAVARHSKVAALWARRSIVHISPPTPRRLSQSGSLAVRDELVALAASDRPELAELADAADRHLEWEAALRLSMPELAMANMTYQGVWRDHAINEHNDRRPFDYRYVQQYAEADDAFVLRVDIL